MALVFTVTKRDRTAIAYQHFYHTRSRHDKNATDEDENATFTCGWREFAHCPGKVIMNLQTKQSIYSSPHQHAGDEERCRSHIGRQELNTEVISHPTISIPKVWENKLRAAHDEGFAASFPGLPSTYRQLQRKRQKHAPFVEARSLLDIDITEDNLRTRNGDNFVLCDFGQEIPQRNIIVFATDNFIRTLATEVIVLQVISSFLALVRLSVGFSSRGHHSSSISVF